MEEKERALQTSERCERRMEDIWANGSKLCNSRIGGSRSVVGAGPDWEGDKGGALLWAVMLACEMKRIKTCSII